MSMAGPPENLVTSKHFDGSPMHACRAHLHPILHVLAVQFPSLLDLLNPWSHHVRSTIVNVSRIRHLQFIGFVILHLPPFVSPHPMSSPWGGGGRHQEEEGAQGARMWTPSMA